jgi:hypothetical protein
MDFICKLFDPTADWQFLIIHKHVVVTVKTGGGRVVRLYLGSSLASFASLHCVTSLVPTPESSGDCWFNTSPSRLSAFSIYLWFITTASVVRVPGYRSRGPGFDSRRYQIF